MVAWVGGRVATAMPAGVPGHVLCCRLSSMRMSAAGFVLACPCPCMRACTTWPALQYKDEVSAVIAELAAAGSAALGVPLDAGVQERLCAYARSGGWVGGFVGGCSPAWRCCTSHVAADTSYFTHLFTQHPSPASAPAHPPSLSRAATLQSPTSPLL